ncbi:DUF4123 domain-containing protein [Marinobacter sp. C2H3]|uniref:DUF4123 domain-containing protein n=1 Tax=Marinobacter sp. C2H3 TaxID=3119003 RepID=UPI00300E71B8
MDAAELIETLERVTPVTPACGPASHALVDFAADDSLLALLYNAAVSEPVPWRSLFEDTPWWPHWRAGPALVDLRQAPAFQQALARRMVEVPGGILLDTSWTTGGLHRHLSRWLHQGLTGGETLLRIQDPRKFGPLLCAMPPSQRQALLLCASAWSWHDGHRWRLARPFPATGPAAGQPQTPLPAPPTAEAPALPPDTLADVPAFWLASEAQGYATHYADVVPDDDHPARWVLERLLEADRHGVHASQHLERWLRLALRHGASFFRQPPFNALLDNPQVILDQRLRAMEDILEMPDDQRHPA